MANKMNKTAFIAMIANSNGIDTKSAETAYDMVMNAIRDAVFTGNRLSLAGFGVFYLQAHKGHPIQFDNGPRKVDDYYVFRFTASNALKRSLRESGPVPGVCEQAT